MAMKHVSTRSRTHKNIVHSHSTDLSSYVTFLTGYISTDDPLLSLLTSGRITTSSFSSLFERSQEITWKKAVEEERDNLKLDEKFYSKRFIFNRLIKECSENDANFKIRINQLNEDLKKQISYLQSSYECYRTKYEVYKEINLWRQLQCQRRLFYKKCDELCNLIVLQKLALIIVTQPSGTDSVATTKYEKIGNQYVAKLKARIICLLDPQRVQNCLKPIGVDVTLFPQDRGIDPCGDKQTPMEWKQQVIMTDVGERMFWYAELNENNPITLTKMNPSRRPLYNNGLCNLEFRARFTVMRMNSSPDIISTYTSQYFGLCSHPKYYPKHLAKVFIEEIVQIHKNIQPETHIHMLIGYICELHKRITGVELKIHSRQFIETELQKIYELFIKSAASPTAPVPLFNLTIYEKFLERLFNQIKFMGTHPFLSMMYHDSLFYGIGSDAIDQKISQGTEREPHLIMRFQLLNYRDIQKNADIVVVIYNGSLSDAIITHEHLSEGLHKCFYEAAENQMNQSIIFAEDKHIRFRHLSWYYDAGLNCYNFKQVGNRTVYNSIETLLQSTMNFEALNQQSLIATSSILLSLEHNGDQNLTSDAISVLQNALSQWCSQRNIGGTLTVNNSLTPLVEAFNDDNFFLMTDENTFDMINR